MSSLSSKTKPVAWTQAESLGPLVFKVSCDANPVELIPRSNEGLDSLAPNW